MTVEQAEARFPTGTCADTARQLAALPPLPFAIQELEATRALFGAPVVDQMIGGKLHCSRSPKGNLKDYRILTSQLMR